MEINSKARARELLRKERQKKRVLTLEGMGINTDNWNDKTELRNFVVFGRTLPRAIA